MRKSGSLMLGFEGVSAPGGSGESKEEVRKGLVRERDEAWAPRAKRRKAGRGTRRGQQRTSSETMMRPGLGAEERSGVVEKSPE